MRFARVALLVGAVALAGCDDDDGFTNAVIILPGSLAGTFTLQTANGNTLPAIVADSVSPPLRIEVVSGRMTLRANATFEDVVEFRQTLGGVVTTNVVTCSGTFSVSGNTISFQENGSAPCTASFTGTLSGTTLAASIRGVNLVFTR